MAQKTNNISIVSDQECCGCAACMDLCPKNAISMVTNQRGEIHPLIDNNKCVDCGRCLRICQGCYLESDNQFNKESYIGTYDNERSMLSSSGGVFYLLAKHILIQGGIVYGAAIIYENNLIQCKHIRVDNIENLYKLQGSKYVQSRTDGIFNQVKSDLKCGKTVLFSGTSCQVASLLRFVGRDDNLFTLDLVCHGVPKNSIFNNYIHHLEKKQKCKIIDLSFRKKGMSFKGLPTSYFLTIKAVSSQGESTQLGYFIPESQYYYMFINRSGYREACYHCKYASINKPSDITLGDFVPTDNDISQYNLDNNKAWSSIIINSKKGHELYNRINVELVMNKIPIHSMVEHHDNLQSPSKKNTFGKFLYATYLIGGFPFLNRMINLLEKRNK